MEILDIVILFPSEIRCLGACFPKIMAHGLYTGQPFWRLLANIACWLHVACRFTCGKALNGSGTVNLTLTFLSQGGNNASPAGRSFS
jgi:hypothetical protein